MIKQKIKMVATRDRYSSALMILSLNLLHRYTSSPWIIDYALAKKYNLLTQSMCFHLLVHLIDFRVADSTMTDENGEVEPDDEPPAKRAKYPMEDLGINAGIR